ncbi:1-aminocyclopropane-1-carboxylate deaminase/D-cysteine desulfhydrase [Paractinoplanes globisporus]|uniref:1-aminocyclopropane-1-carboxylate deaminase/D-cysteine desulfhydrase n=1 Tax=Paractinoplanes globisporus TaxID=113565 RepID=A0ABW6WHB1_9ACTN|nr:pyridoxal-phosphate dependent enzyme [Actinoplanes globisporus]
MLRLPSPLEALDDERFAAAGIRMFLKRDDLIHPDFPGNKWRKLKYNLVAARAAGHGTLLTFGGAYSNHLRATAAAGHHFGFATIGVVRGEEHLPLNPILSAAVSFGMTLVYVDRTRYRAKAALADDLHRRFGNFHLIPEGGANLDGVRGCSELIKEIMTPYDVICCSVGTGATLAGLAAALGPGRRAIGFAALKGDFLPGEVRRLQPVPTANWEIEPHHHFGGYARRTPELDAFVEDFRERHGITLNWVYEAKMMHGLLSRTNRFKPGTIVVALIA